jgi:4-hydroxy-tetrahydrodipicolinate synthase
MECLSMPDTLKPEMVPTQSAAGRSLRGVVAAIITPLDRNGAPDAAQFCNVARALLSGGCDSLNVLGTTGEATSFSLVERGRLMEEAAKSGLPLDRMMVGTGAAAVDDAIRLTGHARALGFAGALILPPFYYKNVSDDGIFAYLAEIVESLRGKVFPIYLYNFPALSGVPYSVELVRRLLSAYPDHLAGLKDSSGDLNYARAVAAIDSRLAVFPSSEACLKEARSGIFAGCISATANLTAAFCADAFHKQDDRALAKAVALRDACSGVPLVPAVKSIMAHVHGSAALENVKPPLVRLDPEHRARLIAEYERILQTDFS